MTMRCPSGHDSSEADYCSVCGAAMAAGAAGGGSSGASSGGGSPAGVCPACSEPRADQAARFCEVCRYDFVAQKPGPAPRASVPQAPPPAGPALVAAKPPPPPPPVPAAPSPPVPTPPVADPTSAVAKANAIASLRTPTTTPAAYVLVVQVDPSLDTDPDPSQPCPTGTADVHVLFDRPEILIGRRDDLRDVHPDIPVSDPGTSRRHAKLVQALDGSIALVDLASTNGSKLNGVEVSPGSRSPLHVGDEVTIGRWTRVRITVRT